MSHPCKSDKKQEEKRGWNITSRKVLKMAPIIVFDDWSHFYHKFHQLLHLKAAGLYNLIQGIIFKTEGYLR